MTRRGSLRAYISSVSKFNFHVDEDENKLKQIAEFLIQAGKVRLNPAEKRENSACFSKQEVITIGLRQTLKAFYKKNLKWIVLDSDVISPSAISHVFGLLGTSTVSSNVSFYVFKGLSSILSKNLKLPRVSAVGFGSDCQLNQLFDQCSPIEPQASNFAIPELHQPVGKPKAQLSKKQKKKLHSK